MDGVDAGRGLSGGFNWARVTDQGAKTSAFFRSSNVQHVERGDF